MIVTAGKVGTYAAAPCWGLEDWQGKGRERASLKDMKTQTVASQTQSIQVESDRS